jgi:hypothetical protein
LKLDTLVMIQTKFGFHWSSTLKCLKISIMGLLVTIKIFLFCLNCSNRFVVDFTVPE